MPGRARALTNSLATPLALLLVVSLCVGGCGDAPDAAPETQPVAEIGASEPEALRLEQDLAGLFLAAVSQGQIERAEAGLLLDRFRGSLPKPTTPEAGPGVTIEWLQGAGDSLRGRPFITALHGLAPLTAPPERLEAQVESFELRSSDDRSFLAAAAEARLRWCGRQDGTGSRVDLTLHASLTAERRDGGNWQLTSFAPRPTSESHSQGPGYRLVCGDRRFVERSTEVGLTFGTSAANQELIQAFVDRHRTLTLGGLSVVDANRDGFPDLLATRSNEQTILFRGDGAGGFAPTPLPIKRLADRPAFVLMVDLDGDGRDEIVASETGRYEGGTAYAGLWTQTGAAEGSTWRHLPRAFALPNPVGLRRLAVQTVAPLDVDGDGDLDLFFAVYGSAASRGERYNTVTAHDGADNHLLINQGGLRFTEESDERGIHGTDYTYVALAFDVDHDGDPDLFEGNDFGPNILWRNEGGRFVADTERGFDGFSAYTMGAALADLEADGRWDLYVSNMSSEEGMRMVPRAEGLSEEMRGRIDTIAHGNMLHSEGAPGSPWTERAQRLAIHDGEWAWGTQFFDVDGDGGLELAVTNGFASHRDATLGDWQTYYWRQVIDDGRRLERGELSQNVNADVRFRGSFNGHEHDRLYVRATTGSPDRPWVDAAWSLGLDAAHDGRALVPIDADGDGDLDVALWTLTGLRYFENLSPPSDWIRVELQPAAPPYPALGARVYAERDGKRRAGHVALVEGFQSQILPEVQLFLGEASGDPVDSLEVHWPGRGVERFQALPVGHRIVIREGEGVLSQAPPPSWAPEARPVATEPGWERTLAQALRTPRALGLGDTPMVVTVHVDWPETPDALVTALRAQDVDVVHIRAAMRTGAQDSPPGDPRTHALVEPELVANAVGAANQATIVYTADGQPLRVIRGPADPATVLGYCELARDERRYPHLLVEHGRLALDESRYRDALELFSEAVTDREDLSVRDAPAFEGLGRAWVLLGRLDRAEEAYLRSVEVDPDYAIGHINLGATWAHGGRFEEATEALLQARRIEGDTERVTGSLAEAAAGAGRLELAAEVIGVRLRSLPRDPATLVLAGKIEAQARRYAAAVPLFERALSLDPGNGDARAALKRARELAAGAPGPR